MANQSNENLAAVLEAARKQLSASPEGWLLLGQRQAIWKAFETVDGNGSPHEIKRLARCRRAELALRCVEHVEKFWDQVDWDHHPLLQPTDRFAGADRHFVRNAIDAARAFMAGTLDGKQMTKIYLYTEGMVETILHRTYDDHTRRQLLEKIEGKVRPEMDCRVPGLEVGMAAVDAALTAQSDEHIPEGEINTQLHEFDVVDEDFHDAAYYASMVHSQLAEGPDTPTRRRAFWQWYLDDAIPQVLDQIK